MPKKKAPKAEEVIHFHKDGSIRAKGQSIDGVQTGYWEWFRKSGVIMRSGHFDNGIQVGDWTTYVFAPPDRPDPRITRLGALARKTSVDELPNLLNVFLGDMSLVGPRPEIPALVEQYPAEYHRRHDVLPGIAGLAQVEGRSDLAYAEVMKYDLAYVDTRSFLGDLRILWKTVAVVARGSGAR